MYGFQPRQVITCAEETQFIRMIMNIQNRSNRPLPPHAQASLQHTSAHQLQVDVHARVLDQQPKRIHPTVPAALQYGRQVGRHELVWIHTLAAEHEPCDGPMRLPQGCNDRSHAIRLHTQYDMQKGYKQITNDQFRSATERFSRSTARSTHTLMKKGKQVLGASTSYEGRRWC